MGGAIGWKPLLAVLALLTAACGPTALAGLSGANGAAGEPDREIVVFAAASLTDAFREIGAGFEAAQPGRRVVFNFGASSQLRTQLEQGARADLFAPASQLELERARQAGAIVGPERVFARNRLVVIFPRGNPGRLAELRDLARPGLKLVTAAPEVPIGVYTDELLERLSADPAYGPDFGPRVRANFVSREPNVRQIVARVSLGEADGAVVYASDLTPDLAASLGRLAIPERFDRPLSYPLALAREAPNPAGGEAFVSYLLSPAGQAILEKWGFLPAS